MTLYRTAIFCDIAAIARRSEYPTRRFVCRTRVKADSIIQDGRLKHVALGSLNGLFEGDARIKVRHLLVAGQSRVRKPSGLLAELANEIENRCDP
jgi:hypothetical protein